MHYNRREYDESYSAFQAMRKIDPHKLETLDVYANATHIIISKMEKITGFT